MNCEHCHAQLSAFIDGALDESDRTAIEQHLVACASCQTELAVLKQTVQQLSSLPAVEPPPGFSQRVMAHVREEAQRSSVWRFLFFPLRVKIPVHATAAVLIGGLVFLLYNVTQRPLFDTEPQVVAKAERERTMDELLLSEAERRPEVPEAQDTVLSQERLVQDRSEMKEKATVSSGITVERPAPLKQAKATDEFAGMKKEAEDSDSVAGLVELPREEFESLVEEGIGRGDIAAEHEATQPPRLADKASQTEDYVITITAHSDLKDRELFARRLDEIVAEFDGEYQRESKTDEKIAGSIRADGLTDRSEILISVPSDQYEQFTRELSSIGTITSAFPDLATTPPLAQSFSGAAPPARLKSAPIRPVRIKLILLIPE